jgi:ubiquinone/menaquinone biosynthesis C-methylase UbiE
MVPEPPPLPPALAIEGDTIDEEQTAIAAIAPLDKIRGSYDIVAERYATELADEMVARPIERGLLLAFSELVRELGPGIVGDVGCGPGHITKHLASLGLRVVGYDFSPAMIAQARVKFPDGEVVVASMFELPVPSGAWTGASMLWSTLHYPEADRLRAFREIQRVVRAGGYFLHSFYISAPDQPEGSIYQLQKWFGHKVDLATYFVGIDQGAAELDRAGFDVMAALVREPLHSHELPTRRCYMLGKRR